jgi:hypothetical protein
LDIGNHTEFAKDLAWVNHEFSFFDGIAGVDTFGEARYMGLGYLVV